jgi:hypothetical protein
MKVFPEKKLPRDISGKYEICLRDRAWNPDIITRLAPVSIITLMLNMKKALIL